MAGGGSPYAAFSSVPVTETGFVYPPFAALLVRPLALLSTRTAMVVWLWLTLACAVTGAIVVARTPCRSRGRGSSWRSWEPSRSRRPRTTTGTDRSIRRSSSCSAISYWAYVRDRQVTAGILLGLAAGIKIAPVIFLIVLIRRRWVAGNRRDGVDRRGHPDPGSPRRGGRGGGHLRDQGPARPQPCHGVDLQPIAGRRHQPRCAPIGPGGADDLLAGPGGQPGGRTLRSCWWVS